MRGPPDGSEPVSAELELVSVAADAGLKERVFDALRRAILDMDVYVGDAAPRLDERQLAERLGVSRTPVREALSRLQQEGLVRSVPRRGMFVVRKSRREIVEIIEVWAALESMAARLAATSADDAALEAFGRRGGGGTDASGEVGVDGGASGRGEAGVEEPGAGAASEAVHPLPIDEYSEKNIAFHQEIIALSGNDYLVATARRSFDHIHAIRASTIRDPSRAVQSIIDHRLIVEALLARQADRAERLVRDHALNLARHVERNASFLD